MVTPDKSKFHQHWLHECNTSVVVIIIGVNVFIREAARIPAVGTKHVIGNMGSEYV